MKTKSKQPIKVQKRKPRQRMRKRLNNNKVRTLGTVVHSLAAKSPTLKYSNPYVHCRRSPFTGRGGAAIPDGGNSNFVVNDTFAIDTISVSTAGASFIIQTTPTLPSLAMVASLGPLTVNGTSITANGQWQPASDALGKQWTPIAIPSSFIGAYTPGTNTLDPWNSTSWRFIAIGYRIIYTGPVVTCAGSIVVTPNNVSYAPGTMSTAAGAVLRATSNTNTDLGAYLASTPLLQMDITSNPVAFNRASRTFRPEEQIMLLAQHSGTNFDSKPTPGVSYGVVSSNSVASNVPISAYNILRQVGNNGVIVWDNAWSGYQIAFSGLNADASFRFETVVCFEVNPSISSPFYAMTIKESPRDPLAVEHGNKASGENAVTPQ